MTSVTYVNPASLVFHPVKKVCPKQFLESPSYEVIFTFQIAGVISMVLRLWDVTLMANVLAKLAFSE